ncbi:MAG: radical SAM family heme chaperone HemW [Clostridia bacterium]|nr:radical SAM family heme chaperone HemW [Clostridia bacterium]
MGIYIHVPFCRSKCYYCDFCSQTRATEEQRELYVNRLIGEISSYKENGRELVADTVYFGGGTPTLLDAGQLGRILCAVDSVFGIEKNAEITAETNPKTVDAKALRDIRNAGVNRLSIGMQSANDVELRALGRIHTYNDFLVTFSEAREAGFDNISADLMYGIPEQTKESFEHSVRALAALCPEHISSYSLTVEEGTPFYRRRDSLALPDEDRVSDMYLMMSDILRDSGYEKYEISNFAHKGRESRHNVKYWRCEEYIGFGPAAHSFFAGRRYSNSRDIGSYLGGQDIRSLEPPMSKREAMDEFVMLGMRLSRGIDKAEFSALFGEDFDILYGNTFARFAPEFVYIDKVVCRFTDKGMLVSNYILSET